MCQKPYKWVFTLKMVQAIRQRRTGTEGTYGCGFSLLELVLVLAIIATLTAIAVPRYQASEVRYRADLAARRIVADLALAQSNAKAASSSRSVVFSPGTDQYQMPDLPPLDGTVGSYSVQLSGKTYGADITSANFGGDQEVVFNGWGIPDSGGTVVITVGSEQRTVTVDAETGKAQIQ